MWLWGAHTRTQGETYHLCLAFYTCKRVLAGFVIRGFTSLTGKTNSPRRWGGGGWV